MAKARYEAERMVKDGRYAAAFQQLSSDVQQAALARIDELVAEERQWCDEGNYGHMCNLLPAIALYETLQQTGGMNEAQAHEWVTTKMWASLDPSGMQKLARLPFFLPLMKKVVPAGFKKKSGAGWRYAWHPEDAGDEFHFECHECLYQRVLSARGLLEKLGPMWCRADVINYGNLPRTDFIRTQTLCQGGQMCDFRFVRHETEAGDGWERTESV